jgi:hypothetical protein
MLLTYTLANAVVVAPVELCSCRDRGQAKPDEQRQAGDGAQQETDGHGHPKCASKLVASDSPERCARRVASPI